MEPNQACESGEGSFLTQRRGGRGRRTKNKVWFGNMCLCPDQPALCSACLPPMKFPSTFAPLPASPPALPLPSILPLLYSRVLCELLFVLDPVPPLHLPPDSISSDCQNGGAVPFSENYKVEPVLAPSTPPAPETSIPYMGGKANAMDPPQTTPEPQMNPRKGSTPGLDPACISQLTNIIDLRA